MRSRRLSPHGPDQPDQRDGLANIWCEERSRCKIACVATEHRHLCPQCGGTVWEQVSEREIRCSECGHGATTSLLTASPVAPGPDRDAAVEQLSHQRYDDALRALVDVPGIPYGLDDQFSGNRWLGGHGGYIGHPTRVTLGHGDEPWDQESTDIRVETRWPDTRSRSPEDALHVAERQLIRSQVRYRWHVTGELTDELRRATFPQDGVMTDPTAPWDSVDIPVDGITETFKLLGNEDFWVAHARHDDVFIGLQARRWPVAKTGLVSITDTKEYEEGSRRTRLLPPNEGTG